MNKEEILAKAQNDNKGMDVADLEVQQKGAYIAYFVGIIGIILVDIINGIVFKVINHGPNMIISLMCFTAFIITLKYFSAKLLPFKRVCPAKYCLERAAAIIHMKERISP